MHYDLRPFSCSLCEYESCRNENFKRHVEKMHTKNYDQSTHLIINEAKQKKLNDTIRADIATIRQRQVHNPPLSITCKD